MTPTRSDRQAAFALRALLRLSLVVAALGLSACGAGGPEGDSGAVSFASPDIGSALRITTTNLPAASRGVHYETAALQATGANGPVRWSLAEGSLPPGLVLLPDGTISGTPATSGFYPFTAEARDGSELDRQALAVSVDTFGVTVTEGLHFGDAWCGRTVTLQCAGFESHAVTFRVVRSDSGGSFVETNPTTGSAIWMPGPNHSDGAQDILEAVCGETETSAELVLDIAPDTTANHRAEFYSSDVWYLDLDGKRGAHPFHTDFHAALGRLGLRTSTSVQGSEVERLAELCVHVTILRRLNEMYLREADGSAGPKGLAISFPLERPGAGYGAPVPGAIVPANPQLYNIMSIGEQNGTLSAYGVAITDNVGNPRVENNTPGGAAGDLGVFTNHVAEAVQNTFRAYGDALRVDPVEANDVEALKAILYNRPSPGGRYDLLSYFVEGLGEALAYIAAHEIGHSLGLLHTHSYTPGSIMNTVGIIAPGAPHFFLEEDVASLRLGLPGGGRITGQQKMSTAQMAIVTVCDGHCHDR